MILKNRIYIKNIEQYNQFRDWIFAQPPLKDKYGEDHSLITNFISYDNREINKAVPVFIGNHYEDAYIIRNCPYEFIQNQLREMCGDSYDNIKEGKLYNTPYKDYEIGQHVKIIKKYKGSWPTNFLLVEIVDYKGDNMRYSERYDGWSLVDEFAIWDSFKYAESSSVKALIRKIRKWKLPIGATVYCEGRKDYVFKVLK